MKNNLLSLVILLTVGIILTGALLVPAINNATTETTQYSNENYDFQVTSSPTTALTYTLGDSNALLVNGTDMELTSSQTYAGISSTVFGGQWVNGASFWVDTPSGVYTDKVTSMTINPDGTWSITYNGTEITNTEGEEATDIYAAVPDGELVVYRPSSAVSFIAPAGKSIPLIINYGQIQSGGNTYPLFAKAHLLDGAVVEDYAYTFIDGVKTDLDITWGVAGSSSASISNGVCTYTNWNMAFDIDGYTSAGRYIVLADKEFSVTTPIEGELSLLKILPVLIVISLVIAVIPVVAGRER